MGEDAGGLGLRFKTHIHTRARPPGPVRSGSVRIGSDWIGLDLDKACLREFNPESRKFFFRNWAKFTESVRIRRDCSKRSNVLKHRDCSNRSVVLNRHCTGSNSHLVPINSIPQTALKINSNKFFFSPSTAIIQPFQLLFKRKYRRIVWFAETFQFEVLLLEGKIVVSWETLADTP